ncbi:uncharacterized protein MONOS_921 [Monocercomonoides exilis]|uniref:uncharacterized protein n=1 Tax=Monocercomonoides exilis TaxID=2049356 RepID=UPI003559E761|nr:hypothetical protein MONOS_921 [Monocercomonoides exilis]|eukprot:MONOS_921.1-p1 / transcript=MONOS_921.1 / gene=MONOS_921 / organism=Monocercomonoides_exilis_PA203 / gene_product=unspecified product / transcript_product=unspecified product / location=Mono_scaffold00015:145934-146639(+) / protein_length=210 / sequence_SO=supercontig / SO=protein_coding / is_pseudo=false
MIKTLHVLGKDQVIVNLLNSQLIIIMAANRLFVRNLSFRTNAEQLKAFLEEAGEVVSVVIPTTYGRPRGYGFVEMKTEEGIKKAIENLSGKELNGRSVSIEVSKSEPRAPAPRVRGRGPRGPRRIPGSEPSKVTIHIGNLPPSCTVEKLKDVFAGYKIKLCTVPGKIVRATGKLYAFIEFEDEAEQKRALEQNGKLRIGDDILEISASRA